MDNTLKIALTLGAIAFLGSAFASDGKNEVGPEEELDLREKRELELRGRLSKAGAKEPAGGWKFNDALLGIKDMAVDVRQSFKQNEAALSLLIGAIAGPEALAIVQAGDEFIDWLLDPKAI